MEDIQEHRRRLSTFGSTRVNMMLGIGSPPQNKEEETATIRSSRFGLGNKRTLSQAVEFTGINLLKKKMEVNKCGNLNWVPFEESPNYDLEQILSRGNAGESTKPFAINYSGSVVTSKFSEGIEERSFLENSFWNLIILVGIIVVVLRLSTRKRRKDEMYKK